MALDKEQTLFAVKIPNNFYDVNYNWDEDENGFIKGSISVNLRYYTFTQKRKYLYKFKYYYRTKPDKYGIYFNRVIPHPFRGFRYEKNIAQNPLSAIKKAKRRLSEDIKNCKRSSKDSNENTEYLQFLLLKVYPTIKSQLTKLENKQKKAN